MSSHKTALYHNDNGQPPRQLYVVRENADGTVDLGSDPTDEKKLVVTSCPVSDGVKAGHAVFESGRAKKSSISESDDETKAEKAAREKKEAAERETAEAEAAEKAAKEKTDAAPKAAGKK